MIEGKYIKIVLLSLSWIFSTLLVCSCLPRFVKPQEFCLFEIVSLGFSAYLLLNVCSVIFWLVARDRKSALLLCVPLLASLGVVSDTYAFSRGSAATGGKRRVTVVSYNVHAFNQDGWRGRPGICGGVVSYLRDQEPDIICFQEFHHDKHEAYVTMDSIRELGLGHVYICRESKLGDYHFYGTVIFSRFPILNSGTLRYQDRGNNTIWVDLALGEDTIRVYNSHLESYRFRQVQLLGSIAAVHDQEADDGRALLQRVRASVCLRGQQADTLVAHMARCPYKMLVCGDFNSPPSSYVYQEIRNTLGLKDAFLESGRGVGGTLNWKLPPKRIDYILSSKGLNASRFDRAAIPLSDHFPVRATLEIE